MPETREPLPAPILEVLRQTRPWVTFFAVLGLMAAVGAGYGSVRTLLFSDGFWNRARGAGMVLVSVVYFLPTMYLLMYRGALARIVATGGGMASLTVALRHQKSFWRAAGIISLVTFALYLLFVLVAFAVAGVMAMRS